MKFEQATSAGAGCQKSNIQIEQFGIDNAGRFDYIALFYYTKFFTEPDV